MKHQPTAYLVLDQNKKKNINLLIFFPIKWNLFSQIANKMGPPLQNWQQNGASSLSTIASKLVPPSLYKKVRKGKKQYTAHPLAWVDHLCHLHCLSRHSAVLWFFYLLPHLECQFFLHLSSIKWWINWCCIWDIFPVWIVRFKLLCTLIIFFLYSNIKYQVYFMYWHSV